MTALDHAYLVSQLRYDPETGLFWWQQACGRWKMGVPIGCLQARVNFR